MEPEEDYDSRVEHQDSYESKWDSYRYDRCAKGKSLYALQNATVGSIRPNLKLEGEDK
jgi:hypothetical protein